MRVLVVDDDEGIRFLCRTILQEAGFEVAEAGDGDDGLASFRARPADVVLCDIFMPGRDGLELIRELVQTFAGARVIAMSGGGFSGKFDLLPMAAKLGAIAVLRKPFDKEVLLAAIRAALP